MHELELTCAVYFKIFHNSKHTAFMVYSQMYWHSGTCTGVPEDFRIFSRIYDIRCGVIRTLICLKCLRFGIDSYLCFQTGGSQRAPHYFGAGLAFFLGGIYCWIQTALTYKVLFKFRRERLLMILQIVNSVILTLMLVLCILSKCF